MRRPIATTFPLLSAAIDGSQISPFACNLRSGETIGCVSDRSETADAAPLPFDPPEVNSTTSRSTTSTPAIAKIRRSPSDCS